MSQTVPQPVIVLRFNHFDPLWRRCWDRSFEDSGRRFVSYRAIEEAWISDALATCADGVSCFMVECSWVLRHYLERHPEQRQTLRQLAQEGRFELLGSGENIVDANLIHGELLARNLILGTLWAEQTLGLRPSTGWHSDGFGSSAQMPQIFRQCGYDWLPALSYNTPDAPYWRGLDGSILFFANDMLPAHFGPDGRLPHRQGTLATIYRKLPPCPACQGQGCPRCDGKGFVVGERAEFTAPPAQPFAAAVGVVQLWGEEIQPGLGVAGAIAAANARDPRFAIRQGIYRDLRPWLAKPLALLDAPPTELVSSKIENNPSQSGCYVSRIGIKQGHRRAEHALLAAERWDALLQAGAHHATLRDAWQRMTLSAFHDSITSSHCDPAGVELHDLQRQVQTEAEAIGAAALAGSLTPCPETFTVFNHHDRPATVPVTLRLPGRWTNAAVSDDTGPLAVCAVQAGDAASQVTVLAAQVPALGARVLHVAPAAVELQTALDPKPGEVACGPWTLQLAEHGIARVSHERFGEVARAGAWNFGELLLEHDLGDPWGTRSLDRTRERLGPSTRLTGLSRGPHSLTVTCSGRHPSTDNPHFCDDPQVTYLAWEQRFILRAGLPWLEVETRVEWYTQNRRLRLVFPSLGKQDRGVYEIPYGVLERDRYEGTSTHGGNAGGDWPALHWAGVQILGYTFAVFNRGTPSYRVENGAVLVSLLRSPTLPYCLLEPESYVAHNYGGMLDAGSHRFHHALYIGPGDWRENDTQSLAEQFNAELAALPGELRKPLPEWQFRMTHARLGALKAAEDGQGLILRLAESGGRPETVRFRAPAEYRRAWRGNLLEETPQLLAREGAEWVLPLAPWEIATIRLTTA